LDSQAGGKGEQQVLNRDWMVEFRDNLLHGILGFWIDHGIDRQCGGAIGWLDRQGNPLPPGTKSVAQQGRLLWVFSQVYRRYPEPVYGDAAGHLLRFLRLRMKDHGKGGYYWLVDRQGVVLNGAKFLNPMAYVLEGLAEYALAFHDSKALQEALDLFELMDKKAHDPVNGGYRVAFDEDWQPLPEGKGESRSSASACVSPSEEIHPVVALSRGRKSSDWHLGILEALATLYRVTGETFVGDRLRELLFIYVERIVDPDIGYARWYFTDDWEPSDRGGDAARCLYGLDMEMSWLITEAATLLGLPNDPKVRHASKALVDHALRDGFDSPRGGLYLEGPAAGPADSKRKEWWQQAEALVGILNAWQREGDSKYREAFELEARYVLDEFTDHEYGEWYSSIDSDGRKDGTKAGPWRGPYHATRACLEVIRRLGGTL
jgi:mannobiose 2-epimerase